MFKCTSRRRSFMQNPQSQKSHETVPLTLAAMDFNFVIIWKCIYARPCPWVECGLVIGKMIIWQWYT